LAVNGSEGAYSEPKPAQAQARSLKTLNFVVTARYGQESRPGDIAYLRAQGNPDLDDVADIIEGEQAIPVALDCSAHELLPNGNTGAAVASPYTVQNTISTNLNTYSTRPTTKEPVYLNEMTVEDLVKLNGIGQTLAQALFDNKPYRNKEEIRNATHIAEGRWSQMQSTPGVEVRIYRR